ncbi:MAG: hydrogenase maturation protease [Synechococcus sp.]|nr:hydrogenase maturation protease [Synechococcus sp.]
MAEPGADLVIGLGNPLRQDDGVAWQLLEELEASGMAATDLRICQQLLPELAAELAGRPRVLFVDAALGIAEPRLEPLEPDPLGAAHPHQLTPAGLLALGRHLFAAAPAAAILLVPGSRFGHGPGLSAPLRRQLPAARALLRGWLQGGRGPCTN